MNQKILRTKIPKNLQGLPKIPYCTYSMKIPQILGSCKDPLILSWLSPNPRPMWQSLHWLYRPSYYTADRLLVLCNRKNDRQPEADYWNWTPEDVAKWVAQDLNHSELQEAFLTNEIDGKGLINLEADRFPRINIKQFDLIKELTSEIRKLCKLDQDEFERSISLPFRRPKTLYLWYKSRRTGPKAHFMTLSKYLTKIKIIREETSEIHKYYDLRNHWHRIPPYIPWCPHVMFGNSRRINPMTGTAQRQNFHPKKPPYVLKDLCIYQIPCEHFKTNIVRK